MQKARPLISFIGFRRASRPRGRLSNVIQAGSRRKLIVAQPATIEVSQQGSVAGDRLKSAQTNDPTMPNSVISSGFGVDQSNALVNEMHSI